VSICGGGGGISDYNGTYRVAAGSGAETQIRLFAPSEISWPVQVAIGDAGVSCPGTDTPTRGGSTSFGSYFTVSGGWPMVGTSSGGCCNAGAYEVDTLWSGTAHSYAEWPAFGGDTSPYMRLGMGSALSGGNYIRMSPGVFISPTIFKHTGFASTAGPSYSYGDTLYPGLGVGESYFSKYGLGNYGRGAFYARFNIVNTSYNTPFNPAGPGVCIIEWAE